MTKHLFKHDKAAEEGVNEGLMVVTYCSQMIPKSYVPHDWFGNTMPEGVTTAIEGADCPKCIKAWEREPVHVTNVDLLHVVMAVGDLANLVEAALPKDRERIHRLELLGNIQTRLREIEDHLQRPRRKP